MFNIEIQGKIFTPRWLNLRILFTLAQISKKMLYHDPEHYPPKVDLSQSERLPEIKLPLQKERK
jgi:hypothetical protein